MATTTIRITGTQDGLTSGAHVINIAISTAAGAPDRIDLASGFQTIAIPSGMTGCIFAPPSSNTQTITFKGVTGDTSWASNKTRAKILDFDTGVTSFGVTTGGIITGVSLTWF